MNQIRIIKSKNPPKAAPAPTPFRIESKIQTDNKQMHEHEGGIVVHLGVLEVL